MHLLFIKKSDKRNLTLYFLLILSVLLFAACDEREQQQDDRVIQEQESAENRQSSSPGDEDSSTRTILILGNSITAGYGLSQDQAFPSLIQAKIDSLGWNFRVINAGLSGETTAGGLRRLDWLLRTPVDILLLELGGNDGLRGIPPETTKENLKAIIERTRERNPDTRIILAGMQIPPNLGPDYAQQFRELFPEVATDKETELIPFLLEGVGGVPELNLPDGIHPTATGHRIVAENVWETLKPVLESMHQTL